MVIWLSSSQGNGERELSDDSVPGIMFTALFLCGRSIVSLCISLVESYRVWRLMWLSCRSPGSHLCGRIDVASVLTPRLFLCR